MYPVGVDFSTAQLSLAERFQSEFDCLFPLVAANAEDVPFDDGSFDVAISEYGASVWCDPRRWLQEANRLLRPGGRLVFFTNSQVLFLCTAADGSLGEKLARDHFTTARVEFGLETGVEFHPSHSEWIRHLRAFGFTLENLIEPRPSGNAKARYGFVTAEWARRWPSEEIWIARKVSSETHDHSSDARPDTVSVGL
jgi:SAM-dependent methyltransferase